MAKKFRTFSQVAFTKYWDGSPHVGIVLRQQFYDIPRAVDGNAVLLREPEVRKMSDYSPVEYSLDGVQWSALRYGRPI